MFTNLSLLSGIGMILLSLQTVAQSDISAEYSKDEWLKKLKSVAPEVICKGFFEEESLKKRLQELKIDNNKCIALIPASFDKCKDQHYANLPAKIDRQSASKWGHTLGECIGTDFAIKYLIPDSASGTPASTGLSHAKENMAKDQWLTQLETLAPSMICQGFLEEDSLKEKFKAQNIDNTKCMLLIPASFSKCKSKYYSSLPAMINTESASTWGTKIGECVGADFAEKYLTDLKKSD
ncbi:MULTISPECIES: hypothetical protein [unclassified Legionella]|uniref:hypothetical protein n=1 Tax=unclassified Legionella TaxID=2622702 RepID=UPI001056260F|nr:MULTISPECIES: hypothetical protein [unclassified Legionella]MDI9819834.1 hypothetical protein [Legionella sp. PL877]